MIKKQKFSERTTLCTRQLERIISLNPFWCTNYMLSDSIGTYKFSLAFLEEGESHGF